MGTVVDNELKVIGVSGLRVCDASVIPKITSGNIHVPVIIVAERLCELLKESYNF